ncbi:WXG100 family type VII secretion target [Actinoplanes sp. NPDC049265]|uniref:WXG100 family type VII secretion target n=1 Tax=Actinoplanes sp. NPDC049265 TaxID=3363902 RepID=UPI00371EE3AF
MNDGVLLVNFGALQNAAANIQSAVNKLDADLAELDSQGSKLLQHWNGEAQAAYHQRQTTWTNSANDLKQILQSIRNAVEHAASNYHETEKRATNRFQ